MKKLLALVLALVMTLSLAVVGSNAAFKDAKDTTETYAEAVDVLSGMGVFNGYKNADGTYSFQPKGEITRAEVAAIVYRLYTGDVTDAQASLYATYNKFADMDGAAWAKGYIGYCANAGLVKGYDAKTFGPANKVTGYEALAMILRAIGYDKNGEFTGAQWQLYVAQTAQQLGILANVKGVDLNAAATRELVAELLFQTAIVPMVSYTPAFGYVANSVVGAQKSLGEKNFGLKRTNGTNDVWGRPSHTWNYITGNKKTVVADKAVASYKTKVDECDIAKDLGITTKAAIESGWIDGYKYPVATNTAITTDADGAINALNTTSYVGGQGRVTEVYDMGAAGYRLVEINTYLAKVTAVTAAKTDKNGHTTDATIDVDVYTSKTQTGVGAEATAIKGTKAEGFTKDQYVLVTMYREKLTDAYKVASVEAATLTAVGAQTGYTAARGTVAATSIFGTAKYDNADKFFLNQFSTVNDAAKKNWSVATDSYGNAIGLVEAESNYLVIEAARFDRTAGTLYNGKVIADVVLADGTRASGVTIAQVGDKLVSHASAAGVLTVNVSGATVTVGSFSDDIASNSAYYNHVFAYTVNADGNYVVEKASNAIDLGLNNDKATISNKGTYIYADSVAIAVNDATVFLVADKDSNGQTTYTYTTYVGKANVPSLTGATVCYIKDADSAYATFVVVTDYNLATNTFDAYLPSTSSTTRDWTNTNYAYTVYKLGSDAVDTVFYAKSSLADKLSYAADRDGIYTITVNSKNEITNIQLKILRPLANDSDDTTNKFVGSAKQIWARVTVGYNDGTTLIQKGSNPANTFNVADANTFVVTYDNLGNFVSIAKAENSTVAAANDLTFIGYKENTVSGQTYQDVDYLYVFKTVSNIDGTDTTPANVTKIEIKSDKSVYLTLDNAAKVGAKYSFTLYRMTENGVYGEVGTFEAVVQGNTKAAWVDMSSLLTAGTSYKVSCGEHVAYKAF